ncbi:hypothetical protein P4V43_15785 [Brevibacillus fortis]|uniref:hypothetical protein n=1 Tax=Brevibacillus fortis TaxID=2126352 RepID=UPI002E1D48C4|nr:hypothetical protein [Brevibacillus fortis]
MNFEAIVRLIHEVNSSAASLISVPTMYEYAKKRKAAIKRDIQADQLRSDKVKGKRRASNLTKEERKAAHMTVESICLGEAYAQMEDKGGRLYMSRIGLEKIHYHPALQKRKRHRGRSPFCLSEICNICNKIYISHSHC